MLRREDIMKLANLSKLDFDSKELDKFTEQLGKIMNYVDKIEKLNVSDVEPLYNCSKDGDVFREDNVIESDTKLLLENAPNHRDNYIIVPKILS